MPFSGERIKYCVEKVVAATGDEDSVFCRTWEIEQFLFGDLIPDVDFVIHRHILAGLERLLGAVHPTLRATRWEHEIKRKQLTSSTTNMSNAWNDFSAITCIACKYHETEVGNMFCEECKRSSAVLHTYCRLVL